MVSLIAVSSANFIVCHQPISYLSSYSCLKIVSAIIPLKRDNPLKFNGKQVKQKNKNHVLIEFSGFCGVVKMCKNWGGESDPSLELEVLEFMRNSKNPQKFPTKNELISAGRMDLVDAIKNKGGWMRVGWDDEVSEGDELENDLESFFGKYGQNGCKSEVKSRLENIQERCFQGTSFLGNSSATAASSSGRSLELAAEDESGIDGILNRLERQRNLSLGSELGKNDTSIDYADDESGDKNQNGAMRKLVDSGHPQRGESTSLNHDRPMNIGNGLSKSYSNGFSGSLKTDSWRTWSVTRAGLPDTEFEAGEIDFDENANQVTVDDSIGDIVAVTSKVRGAEDKANNTDAYYREITQGDLKSRLQHLEVELSSALHLVRSNTNDLSGKAKEQLPEDLSQLSDVSEFQENEMMNAQDKLRTLRAKLKVLEGKMSLAIMDAQHILDEKQRRINDARTALQLLRTTCIIWPNSGSEVLLAGSFDGWATQRKMARSSTGIFSLCLKLYPGRYEIKFIVDGVWRVDPLRPIVNNGFENNLLTVD